MNVKRTLGDNEKSFKHLFGSKYTANKMNFSFSISPIYSKASMAFNSKLNKLNNMAASLMCPCNVIGRRRRKEEGRERELRTGGMK